MGESTTDYTKSPNYSGVPERIHDFCPDAKIIYIMRDPIERAISQYWWEVQYSAEGRRMSNAILNNDWIMNASNYALQLKPYIKLFGAGSVFTLTMEELQATPQETLKSIFIWLNVDPAFKLNNEFKTYNQSANRVNRVVGSGFFSHMKGTKLWEALKQLLPRKFKKSLKRLLSRPVAKNEADREDTIALLRPIMQQQVEELSKLLGRDFPEWTTLYGSYSD